MGKGGSFTFRMRLEEIPLFPFDEKCNKLLSAGFEGQYMLQILTHTDRSLFRTLKISENKFI